jgi:glycosyltransferase involved in cell wall biosynthesis
MNILMMTNTYTPIVGGLERSVREFKNEFQRRGHRVMVVAPKFEGMPEHERDVLRVPALQHFNGSDFSVKLPVPRLLSQALVEFYPDIIHAHHPFLIGNTAVRLARTRKVPLVFTHHTLFEQYTHYVPLHTPRMEQFVIELSTGYANLCDHVFAPSESVARLLRSRGVRTPVSVMPTGIDVSRFARGHRREGRAALGLPEGAFVVGHVGRLAPEKNLTFLAQAMALFLRQERRAHAVIVGTGPSADDMRHLFAESGVLDRLHLVGMREGRQLADAYRAMDVFAFSSKSETQGLVVTEAMAAGLPVVALDASGVREVVRNGENGRLLRTDNVEEFASALRWVAQRPLTQWRTLSRNARQTAEAFAMPLCAERALARYVDVIRRARLAQSRTRRSGWATAIRRIRAEWDMLKTVTKATRAAVRRAA